MKKLVLVAMVASFATAAFAQKHMVQFYGWDTGMRADSFDFSMTSNDADSETSTTNIALNYAYAITPAYQLGLTYKSYTGESAGNDVDRSTTGVNFFWNVNNQLTDTHVLGLRYWMTNWGEAEAGVAAKDDTQNDIVLEYGYRWKVGSAWGFDLTYAPRVAYTMSTFSPDAGGDDVKTNSLAWDFLKFDVLF